jgi:hypothetical protein
MRRAATAAIGKPGETVNRSVKPAGKALGIIGGGIAAALGKIADMLFPAKSPSPEQQERNYRAAKQQQATDEIAAKKEAYAQQLLDQIARSDQERARRKRERGRDVDDYGRDL